MFFDECLYYRIDNANMLRKPATGNRRKWELDH
jgi:hypothetical protein